MQPRHFQPVAAALVGFVIPAPLVLSHSFPAALLFTFVMLPLGVLLMLGLVVVFFLEDWPERRLTLLSLISLPLAAGIMYDFDLGDRIRWFTDRSAYKQRIAAEPVAPGGLKHFLWHEDGFAGMNVFEYVVHDPSDRLADVLAHPKDARDLGLPCESHYQRFERGYYKVKSPFAWGDCD